RDDRSEAFDDRPLSRDAGCRPGGELRAGPWGPAVGARRRARRLRDRDLRGRPGRGPIFDERGASRSRSADRHGGRRRDLAGSGPGDPGARPRDDRRDRLGHGDRGADPRGRFRDPDAKARARVRQPARGRDCHRGRPDPESERHRGAGPVLGDPWRRRELRSRHVVHVSSASRREDPLGTDYPPRRPGGRRPSSLSEIHGRSTGRTPSLWCVPVRTGRLGVRPSRCGVQRDHHHGVEGPVGGRDEPGLGPWGLGGVAPIRPARRLCELHAGGSGRRRGPCAGGVRRQVRTARGAEGKVRSRQSVPLHPEHSAYVNRSSRTVGLKILEDRPVSLSALRTFAYNSDTGQTAGRIMRRLALLTVGLLVVLVLGVGVGTPPSIQSAGRLTAAAFTVSFSYSPSTTAANSQTQGMVTFSGGAVPFKVWLNQTPPGCDPGTQPFVTSTYTNSWNCTPTTAGTYNVLLDAVDNTGTRVQTAATLTVQS